MAGDRSTGESTPDVGKAEQAKPEPIKPEASKPEQGQQANVEQQSASQSRQQVKAEQLPLPEHSQPAPAATAQGESSKTEATKTEATKTASATEQTAAQPGPRQELKADAADQADKAGTAESTNAEANKAEASKTDQATTEQTRSTETQQQPAESAQRQYKEGAPNENDQGRTAAQPNEQGRVSEPTPKTEKATQPETTAPKDRAEAEARREDVDYRLAGIENTMRDKNFVDGHGQLTDKAWGNDEAKDLARQRSAALKEGAELGDYSVPQGYTPVVYSGKYSSPNDGWANNHERAIDRVTDPSRPNAMVIEQTDGGRWMEKHQIYDKDDALRLLESDTRPTADSQGRKTEADKIAGDIGSTKYAEAIRDSGRTEVIGFVRDAPADGAYRRNEQPVLSASGIRVIDGYDAE